MRVNPDKIIVRVGLLLQAIADAGFAGIEDAAAACGTSTIAFHKLLNFNGDLPRCDSLFKIAKTLKIDLKELIINAGTSEKTNGSRGRVLSGRWPAHQIVGHDGETLRGT